MFSDSFKTEESDDIHAALALMYGYAAKYAPSTVIEARINALVVGHPVLFPFDLALFQSAWFEEKVLSSFSLQSYFLIVIIFLVI